ncbi:PREDICTED: sodium-dependent glucose transporter 1 [Nanorana parkeri]|uniref:sodium-dependent glucose transporter 1 n=1 Tax=Nanorana parkeri TaxID=125878 RepID=UPI0008548943|nr:PREDICTED: sodium-dependent glucose transporter 1 [Nanorana parkeri]
MAGNGKKKKQVRFARANGDEAGDEEEEDTLFEKRPSRLRAGIEELEEEGERRRAEDEVRLVSGEQQCRGLRCCVTTVMCAAFLGLGMAISVLGPTFPDLAANVDSTVGNISYIFVGRSLGYLGGSVLGGVLFERMNQHLLLGLSMLATCAGLLVLPWCKKAILLTGAMSVVGTSMGFLDTGGNVVILNTWGDEAGPHVQALHFSFALGALLAPILAKLIPEILHLNDIPLINIPLQIKKSMLSYIVIATYILLVSIFLFILYCKTRSNRSVTKVSEEKVRTAKYHNTLIFLLCLFFFCYVGAEVAYGSYIFTYAITMAEMDHDKAAGLNSIFWGVFAAVRGLAICFATCLYPGTMLLLSVIGCTVSSLYLLIFYKKHIVLWVGSALYGASMATTFPSGFSWAQQYTTIGGKSASLFVVGAALGEMAIPASVGYLQGLLPTLPVLMYTIVASSALTAVLFPIMYKLATCTQDKVRWDGVESEDRRALLSGSGLEEEDEEDDQPWNDADFEAIEMNDRSMNSNTVIPEDTSELTSTSNNSSSQALSKNGTLSDQVSRSPLKKLLNVDREKND